MLFISAPVSEQSHRKDPPFDHPLRPPCAGELTGHGGYGQLVGRAGGSPKGLVTYVMNYCLWFPIHIYIYIYIFPIFSARKLL